MLSSAQFAELLKLIQTLPEDGGPKSEVRRSPRLEHDCRVTIILGDHASDESGEMLVQLKDISVRGVCLLHNKPLKEGSSFVARFAAPDGNIVCARAQVVHSRKIDEHTWQIGAEFFPTLCSEKPLEVRQSVEDWMQTRPRTVINVPPLQKRSY